QRVLQTLLGVVARHRLPFALVRLQQRSRRPAGLDGGELPDKVMRILHAGVEPEPTRRRETMRGVADEKHPAAAVAFSHRAGHRPRRDRADGEPDVAAREGAAHQRFACRDIVALRRLTLRIPGVHEDPLAIYVMRDEGASAFRVTDPVEDAGDILYERAQI